MIKLGRRDLAKLLGTAAAGASIAALPFAPRGFADPPTLARAKRVLLINFPGAMRSSAAFLASSELAFNPWGLMETATQTPFSLGALLDDHIASGPGGLAETPPGDDHYRLSFLPTVRVPRLREVAHQALTVFGTYNEGRGDHLLSQVEEATGLRSGTGSGILTRIHQGILAQGDVLIPPFHLRPMNHSFGRARGGNVVYAPVTLDGPYELPSSNAVPGELLNLTASSIGDGATSGLPLDRRLLGSLGSTNRSLADMFATMQTQSVELNEYLSIPYLNTGSDEPTFLDAWEGYLAFAGEAPIELSNARLLEVLSKSFARSLGELVESSERLRDIQNAACAIRCLQLGSTAVALELGDFDWHSDEMNEAPQIYHMVGQLWSALHFLLSNIPEPTATPDSSERMIDHTLVLTTSDFGRDPGLTSTGFNAGDGSDHGQSPSCYYFAHAVMGAGVEPGRLHGGVDTDTYYPDDDDSFATEDLLGTVLYALGLDPNHDEFGFPRANAITRLWGDSE